MEKDREATEQMRAAIKVSELSSTAAKTGRKKIHIPTVDPSQPRPGILKNSQSEHALRSLMNKPTYNIPDADAPSVPTAAFANRKISAAVAQSHSQFEQRTLSIKSVRTVGIASGSDNNLRSSLEVKSRNGYLFKKNKADDASVDKKKRQVVVPPRAFCRYKYFESLPVYPTD